MLMELALQGNLYEKLKDEDYFSEEITKKYIIDVI